MLRVVVVVVGDSKCLRVGLEMWRRSRERTTELSSILQHGVISSWLHLPAKE